MTLPEEKLRSAKMKQKQQGSDITWKNEGICKVQQILRECPGAKADSPWAGYSSLQLKRMSFQEVREGILLRDIAERQRDHHFPPQMWPIP